MPRTKEQNLAIRAEKRQLIMDSALHLFAENGFENTSIENIATHAGISKGLLYAYFENKDDLLQQILTSGIQTASDVSQSVTTMKDFVKNIEKFFDHVTNHKEFYKLYSIITVQPKVTKNLESVMVEYGGMRENMINVFKKHFGEKRALQELLLFSVIMKGFTVVSAFSGQQNVLPTDMLKNTVANFVKERYK